MSKPFDFLPTVKTREATKLLPWAMGIMVYLSALAAAGSLLLHSGFDDWASSLQGRITVQITGEDRMDIVAESLEIQAALRSTPGIRAVRILSDAEISALLEPWLGEGNITDDLPVPVMIDIETDLDTYVNIDALEGKVKEFSDHVYLDDHARWLSHFYDLAYTVEYTALGILIMILIASICIVIFGTKSSMAEHKTTIEIMHLMGAQDNMIAGAYQNRFMLYGLWGGIGGLTFSLITVYVIFNLVENISAGLVELPTFPFTTMLLLFIFPVLFAGLTMLTARVTVLRELGRMV
jgi:cell division transport system permease protein